MLKISFAILSTFVVTFPRCTRLEIGVQSVYEDIARDTNRGHTVRAVCESFQLSKDAGFKVVAHMMPDLPNVDIERDVEQFAVSFKRLTFLNLNSSFNLPMKCLVFFVSYRKSEIALKIHFWIQK